MNENCLALRLEGVLQSWGISSRGKEKTTSSHPTKSGVVGLLGAALGIPRGGDMSELNQLNMSVRVDDPGRMHVEFQSMAYRKDKPITKAFQLQNPTVVEAERNRSDNRIFHKHYLEEASFLVVLDGDPNTIRKCAEALQHPVYPLSLGRRNCPPSTKVLVGTFESDPEFLLRTLQYPSKHKAVIVYRDAGEGERGQLVQDLMVTNDTSNRKFAYREVVEQIMEPTPHDPFAFLEQRED